MGSPEGSNWVFDALIDDIPVATGAGDLAVPDGGFYWTPQGINSSCDVSVENNGSIAVSGGLNESKSRKCLRTESCMGPGSKACREKMRRDKLNDRFLDLRSILEPGNSQKMDKAAILTDAARMVTELRSEAQKLKDSNESLQEKIKELKAEKNELRDEKQRLRAEKENLELQLKMSNARPSFMPPPPVIPTAFATNGQPAGHKVMMPIISYPGYPMWQFMQPADVDTSQDVESCPPVA